MKFNLALFSIVAILGAPFALTLIGCSAAQLAQVQTAGSALIADVAQGTVVATDAYAAYQSVNQQLTAANVTTGKLDVAKVIAGAQAINQTLGSPATSSLVTAANQFVSDVNSQIAAFKAAGATSPAAITTAVSASGAATVTAIAATTPPTTSIASPNPFLFTSSIRPEYGSVKPESAFDLRLARN